MAPALSHRSAAILAPLVAAVVVAGCASSPGPAATTAQGASCTSRSPAAYLALARVAFTGVMLSGPTVSIGQGSFLASPARVRVVRYLKGSGPPTVTVTTAATQANGTVVAAEDGIQPQAGQRWTIYTTTQNQPYQTSICLGSRRSAS